MVSQARGRTPSAWAPSSFFFWAEGLRTVVQEMKTPLGVELLPPWPRMLGQHLLMKRLVFVQCSSAHWQNFPPCARWYNPSLDISDWPAQVPEVPPLAMHEVEITKTPVKMQRFSLREGQGVEIRTFHGESGNFRIWPLSGAQELRLSWDPLGI